MTVEDVKLEVELHLNELRRFFVEECELTFIMRHPHKAGCYMIITNDDPLKLAELLELYLVTGKEKENG